MIVRVFNQSICFVVNIFEIQIKMLAYFCRHLYTTVQQTDVWIDLLGKRNQIYKYKQKEKVSFNSSYIICLDFFFVQKDNSMSLFRLSTV